LNLFKSKCFPLAIFQLLPLVSINLISAEDLVKYPLPLISQLFELGQHLCIIGTVELKMTDSCANGFQHFTRWGSIFK